MENTNEEVINMIIPAGQSSGVENLVPPAGQIIGVKIFYGSKNNPGFVNASIEDNNKTEVSKMQHIDNYRDRDSSYLDCKPFYYEGGNRLFFKVAASAPFTADFLAQMIFIYAPKQNC